MNAKENSRNAYKSEIPDKVRDEDYRERVFAIVRQIPVGKVMTYGQIAVILGENYTPRTVGFVMNTTPKSGDEATQVPWQRVINASGGCSTGHIVLPPDLQQKLLEGEGVKFNEKGRCDLEKYRWLPHDDLKPSEQQTLFGD